LKKARQKREEELEKEGKTPPYPTHDDFRAEAAEEEPAQFLVVRDAGGEVVRRVAAPTAKGLHRVAWDLRLPPPDPARLTPPRLVNAYSSIPLGPMVAPGEFTVSLERRVGGETTTLAGPQPFAVRALAATTLTAPDRDALEAFLRDASALQRAALGASSLVGETLERVALVQRAVDDSTASDPALGVEARRLARELRALEVVLDGDAAVARRQDPVPPALVDRSTYIVYVHWSSTSAPTATSRRQYELASAELGDVVSRLRAVVERDLPALEAKLDAVAAPWTPGRVPSWPPAGG
ncbi:MAG: glycosyl hydrolase, partial [Thermoanaerobaculia bacterium]|nr:glycosyl hydrolase [Thermoanaerobaculia bacterium]